MRKRNTLRSTPKSDLDDPVVVELRERRSAIQDIRRALLMACAYAPGADPKVDDRAILIERQRCQRCKFDAWAFIRRMASFSGDPALEARRLERADATLRDIHERRGSVRIQKRYSLVVELATLVYIMLGKGRKNGYEKNYTYNTYDLKPRLEVGNGRHG